MLTVVEVEDSISCIFLVKFSTAESICLVIVRTELGFCIAS